MIFVVAAFVVAIVSQWLCSQAQHILTTMITARTLCNPETTRGIKMATLYFRPDGQMVSGWLQIWYHFVAIVYTDSLSRY